jgi:hypothetical protein
MVGRKWNGGIGTDDVGQNRTTSHIFAGNIHTARQQYHQEQQQQQQSYNNRQEGRHYGSKLGYVRAKI